MFLSGQCHLCCTCTKFLCISYEPLTYIFNCFPLFFQCYIFLNEVIEKCSSFSFFPSFLQEYVRGLCDPELQKEERYPGDMHCIFAGARGLFLDRLVRDTSAEVVVPEPGRLRLLGRAEPVVMAQSRIQQFVALFQVQCQIV